MSSYNLAALESQLADTGWTVRSDDFVVPQEVPGQVFEGGYTVQLTSPSGDVFLGDGATRSDALRIAADHAGLLPGHGINLI